MNPSMTDDTKVDIPPCFKLFIRLIFKRRRNRYAAPSPRITDALTNCESPNHVEDEKSDSTNNDISTPMTWEEWENRVIDGLSHILEEGPQEKLPNELDEAENYENPDILKNDDFTTVIEKREAVYPSGDPVIGSTWKDRYVSVKEKCLEVPEEVSENQPDPGEKQALDFALPGNWYSALHRKTSKRYGKRVAALVKRFESASCQCETPRNITPKKPPRKWMSNTTETCESNEKDIVTDLKESGKAEHKNSSSNEQDNKRKPPTTILPVKRLTETEASSPKANAKKRRSRTRLPRSDISTHGVPCLVVSSLNKASKPGSSIEGDLVRYLIMHKYKGVWEGIEKRSCARKLLRSRLISQGYLGDDDSNAYAEIGDFKLGEYVQKGDLVKKSVSDRLSTDSGLTQSDGAQESDRNSEEVDARKKFVKKFASESDISSGESDQANYGHYYSIPERSQSSYSCEQSIGSSNISALISGRTSFTSHPSHYSSLNIKNRRQSHPFDSNATHVTVPEYETLPGLIENCDESETLESNKSSESIIQRHIIHQVSRALLVCRNQSQYVDDAIRTEAEKILLLAYRKLEIAEEKQGNHLDSSKEVCISVDIRNLKFFRNTLLKGKHSKKYSSYFVCLLEAGSTVLATEVVKSEGGEILFPDNFHIEGYSEDFVIDIKLFALFLKNKKKKTKINQEIRKGPLRTSTYAPTSTFFTLWANTEINPFRVSQFHRNSFRLAKIQPEALLDYHFDADVSTHWKVLVVKKGFLTVGFKEAKRLPMWNRKWCVLDGILLKYFNHPNEESFTDPVGTVDLMKASSFQVELVDREVCPWPKSLSVQIEECGTWFFTADTVEEFREWREQLNNVLGYVERWKGIGDRSPGLGRATRV